MKENFLSNFNITIQEYREILTTDFIKNELKEKFPSATSQQIEKKINKRLDKINKYLDRITLIVKDEFTDYDIRKTNKSFDLSISKESRIKNLEMLINERVGKL